MNMLLPVSPSGTRKTFILFRWYRFLITSSAPAMMHSLKRLRLNIVLPFLFIPFIIQATHCHSLYEDDGGKRNVSRSIIKLTIDESIIYFSCQNNLFWKHSRGNIMFFFTIMASFDFFLQQKNTSCFADSIIDTISGYSKVESHHKKNFGGNA